MLARGRARPSGSRSQCKSRVSISRWWRWPTCCRFRSMSRRKPSFTANFPTNAGSELVFLPRDQSMKIRRPFRPERSRGAILPLAAISIIGLCGFLALSIDLGMLAVARAEVQNAADAAAICGARSLIGSQGNYVANSTANAIAQATRNTILGTNINPAEVSVLQGNYHYNYTTQKFSPEFPPGTGENYNLT